MSFPVPLAVWVHHFTSTGLALARKWGGMTVVEGGMPGSTAVLVLLWCGGVGHLLGHAWAGESHQGLWGGLPVLGAGVERVLRDAFWVERYHCTLSGKGGCWCLP